MYEYKIIFGHQFVNAIQNVTFTVIQPRRMFNVLCLMCRSSLNWYVPVLYACHTCASVETPYGIQKNAVARGLWHKYEP